MADDEVTGTGLLQELRQGLSELRKITERPVEILPAPGVGSAWFARAADHSWGAGLRQAAHFFRKESVIEALMTGHDPGDEDDAKLVNLLGLLPPESATLHEDFDAPLFDAEAHREILKLPLETP